jgi:two-component system, cell cycle sensor histidine kinase and response regulator CckA
VTTTLATKPTILVVDDDPQIGYIVRSMLEVHGYNVIAVEHGDEALLRAEEMDGSIDLLITDVVMPQLNGEELAGLITRLHGKQRVLYMSGYLRAPAASARGIQRPWLLEKPFTAEVLLRRVREALEAPLVDDR